MSLKENEVKIVDFSNAINVKTFPEAEPLGMRFNAYFNGTMGELYTRVIEQQGSVVQNDSLKYLFQQLIHPLYDIEQELNHVFGEPQKGVINLYISTQCGVPNIHLISLQETVKYLQKCGAPVEFNIISTYEDDSFIDDSGENGDGIKKSYQDLPCINSIHCITRQKLFDSDINFGKPLKSIEAKPNENAFFAELMDNALKNGLITQHDQDNINLPNFYRVLNQLAGIEVASIDKSIFDKRMLAFLISREDLSHLNNAIRDECLMIYDLDSQQYRKIKIKELYDSELGQEVKRLMNQGYVDQAVNLLIDIRLTSRLYYRAFPTHPAASALGGRVHVECYEDGDDFIRMVNEGYAKITEGTTILEGQSRRKQPRLINGAPYSPIVLQEAWLSGIYFDENNILNPIFNEVKTDPNSINSLCVPSFIFDESKRRLYQIFVGNYIYDELGDDVSQLQFADIHACAIMATIAFINNHN